MGTELTSSNYSTAGSTTIPTASGRNAGTYTIYYYIPASEGNQWIIDFLEKADVAKIAIDGASGQKILEEQLKSIKKKAILPTVKEVIVANTTFENNMASKKLCHNNQLSYPLQVFKKTKKILTEKRFYNNLKHELLKILNFQLEILKL